jgi:hypothetical protein
MLVGDQPENVVRQRSHLEFSALARRVQILKRANGVFRPRIASRGKITDACSSRPSFIERNGGGRRGEEGA